MTWLSVIYHTYISVIYHTYISVIYHTYLFFSYNDVANCEWFEAKTKKYAVRNVMLDLAPLSTQY